MRWLGLLVLVPVSLTWWLALAGVWIGSWTAGNAAVALRYESGTALIRAVEGAARLAAVASWIASGWGATASVFPPMERAAEAGSDLQSLAAAGRTIAPALPSALGMEGPRTFAILALNDAELFGSGGAPLSAAVVTMDRMRPSVTSAGSVSREFNLGNAAYPWDTAGGQPWYRSGKDYPLANANFHPDFRTSGMNLVNALNALDAPDLPEVDGVVTVDVTALARVLRVTGPVTIKGFGQVTAENVVRVVLVDAYRKFPYKGYGVEPSGARQVANLALQSAVIARLRDPRTALRAALEVRDVIPSRHVQAYMSDRLQQEAVVALGADGALSEPEADVLAVFSQSSPSKTAIFQQVRIWRHVVIRSDGSAGVTQSVFYENAIPEDVEGEDDAVRGYLALTYRARVAYRIPLEALDPQVRVVGRRPLVPALRTGPFPDGTGAQMLWQGQDVPPRETARVDVAYELPSGTLGESGAPKYALSLDPQPMAQPPVVDLSVTFPASATPWAEQGDWVISGSTAHWQGVLDQPLVLSVAG